MLIFRKKEIKLSLFADKIIVILENKIYMYKFLTTINKITKATGYKINIFYKKMHFYMSAIIKIRSSLNVTFIIAQKPRQVLAKDFQNLYTESCKILFSKIKEPK